MEVAELNARVRETSGKGFSRRLRKEGLIPAVLYGPGAETILLKVSAAELANLRKKEEKAFIKLIIDDQGKKIEKLSIVKELQLEPLSRRFVHADFYEIKMDHTLTFDIPLHFSGKPEGVKDGGELHLIKRELKVSCLPGIRPEFISIDISGLQIGDTFKVQDIASMEGVIILDQSDAAIAALTAVKSAKQLEGGPGAEEGAAAVDAEQTAGHV
jgi:large subunit ribosomal protein L25